MIGERGRIPDWLKHGLGHPIAAAAAMTLGIRFGQEASRLRSGEIGPEEFRRRASTHLGILSGTAGGALAGALLGKLVPGIGRIAGAFAGGLVGEMAGERLAKTWLGRTPQSPEAERPETEPDSDDRFG